MVVRVSYLASDELLRVEELSVGASPDLINHRGLQVNKDSPGHMLACTSFGKEGVEGVISTANGLVRGHLAIRLDAVLQAVELPAGIANLAASLANVDRDALTLQRRDVLHRHVNTNFCKAKFKPCVSTLRRFHPLR